MSHRPAHATRRLAILAMGCALAMVAGCKPGEEAAAPAAAPPDAAPAADAQTPPPEAAADPSGTGDAMPAQPRLHVATLDHGDYDLAARRGKWVVVNFWATWCAPCRKEMPELSALDAMHEHIEVVGLAYEDIDVAAMREFLRAHPVVYPVAIVDVYDPPADFDTPRGLPMTYVIGPDGRVAERFLGPVTAADILGVVDGGEGGEGADA